MLSQLPGQFLGPKLSTSVLIFQRRLTFTIPIGREILLILLRTTHAVCTLLEDPHTLPSSFHGSQHISLLSWYGRYLHIYALSFPSAPGSPIFRFYSFYSLLFLLFFSYLMLYEVSPLCTTGHFPDASASCTKPFSPYAHCANDLFMLQSVFCFFNNFDDWPISSCLYLHPLLPHFFLIPGVLKVIMSLVLPTLYFYITDVEGSCSLAVESYRCMLRVI